MSFRGINTTVIQIRRQVFTEVARMAYANVKGEQANHLMRKIPYTIIPGEEGKLRKDIFLERAIVEERVRLAMGLPTRRMDEHNSVVSGLEDASIADKYYDCLLYTSHAHAVFQLVKVLIELRRGNGPPRLEIPLIAGVDDALAVAALALIAKLLHNVDDSGAGLGIIGGLLEQILAIIRHTAGHSGNALHHRGQLQQVAQGAAKLFAIIDAPAEHQLTVDGDAALHQTGQILEHFTAPLVGQHPDTELGVGGVHRDVDRRDVHLDDAVDLVILHIGHGDVVAEQKAQPLVIILEIQALKMCIRDSARTGSCGTR